MKPQGSYRVRLKHRKDILFSFPQVQSAKAGGEKPSMGSHLLGRDPDPQRQLRMRQGEGYERTGLREAGKAGPRLRRKVRRLLPPDPLSAVTGTGVHWRAKYQLPCKYQLGHCSPHLCRAQAGGIGIAIITPRVSLFILPTGTGRSSQVCPKSIGMEPQASNPVTLSCLDEFAKWGRDTG